MSLLLGLTACSGVETKAEYPNRREGDADAVYGKRESIFGKNGLNLFGAKRGEADKGTGITVNAYLWRAALDTVSFMPIDKADPFGGTILTTWYTAPNLPNDRVKVNVFIIGRELRTDALKVSLFRQVVSNGQWVDVAVNPATTKQLEETILTRARQLKVGESNAQ